MSWWRASPQDGFRRAKYADYFACLDRNDTGALDPEDVATYPAAIAQRLGLSSDAPSLDRLREASDRFLGGLLATMDEDGNGSVSLDELLGAFETAAGELRRTGEIPGWAFEHALATFAVLDVDGDGAISADEYAAYLEAIGSDADAAAAFSRLDEDGDGALPLDEIERLYREWLAAGEPEALGNTLLTGRLPPG